MPRRTLTLEQLSDRFEIQDLVTRYAIAIDTEDWDLLDTVFLPDAWVDYESSGGIKGHYPEVRSWLAKVLPNLKNKMHMVAAPHVKKLDGDTASTRTYLHNPNSFPKADGQPFYMTVSGYYEDELVRTDDGWRIAKRVEAQLVRQDT